MAVGHDGSVGEKFACFVAAVETIASRQADKKASQPIGMMVPDQEQAPVAQLIEKIG